MSEMIDYIRSLTPNTDYSVLLSQEFGYDVPESAPEWQKAYFYKYLIQGSFKGLTGKELEDYAVQNVYRIRDVYYVHLKYEDNEAKQIKMSTKTIKPGSKKFINTNHEDGTIFFDDNIKKFCGIFQKRLVSTANSITKVEKFMTKKYGLTSFIKK